MSQQRATQYGCLTTLLHHFRNEFQNLWLLTLQNQSQPNVFNMRTTFELGCGSQ